MQRTAKTYQIIDCQLLKDESNRYLLQLPDGTKHIISGDRDRLNNALSKYFVKKKRASK
ncbi:MAG: hypothetical protein AAGA60_29225 [Cyanobacteria bacterium P01_E01_bin.42]